MALQISAGSVVRTPSDGGLYVVTLKFKPVVSTAGAVNVLAGNEVLANGGSILMTTNTNAAVATVTLNSSIVDSNWGEANYRDDAQAGNYCTTGNFTGEATSNSFVFKIGYFLAAGTAMTAAQVNTNAVVTEICLVIRNVGYSGTVQVLDG